LNIDERIGAALRMGKHVVKLNPIALSELMFLCAARSRADATASLELVQQGLPNGAWYMAGVNDVIQRVGEASRKRREKIFNDPETVRADAPLLDMIGLVANGSDLIARFLGPTERFRERAPLIA
jgi:hypothetical protein